VVFSDGSFLCLDEFASVEFLSESLVRLTLGRTTLIVKGQTDTTAATARYQVDTPAASIRTDLAGEYRISIFNGRGVPETELAVVRGAAQLATDAGAMMVRAGERSTALDNVAPSAPSSFNSARFDAFDRWTAQRQDAWLGSTSTRYLPQDVQMYAGTFDRYGTWGTDPQCETCGIRPCQTPGGQYAQRLLGLPRFVRLVLDRIGSWVWPTHHWGRWGFARNRWFWIPQRALGVGLGVVGDLAGLRELVSARLRRRPVFGFFGGRSTRFDHDPWGAWTVIPRGSLGRRVHVSASHIDGRRLASASAGFILQRGRLQGPARK
jgi:hypothetical protein